MKRQPKKKTVTGAIASKQVRHGQATRVAAEAYRSLLNIVVAVDDGTYTCAAKGLFYQDKKGRKVRVCAPIAPIARVRDGDGGAWMVRVAFFDDHDEIVTLDIECGDLLRTPIIGALLANSGFPRSKLASGWQQHLNRYLNGSVPRLEIIRVSGGGWQEVRWKGRILRDFVCGLEIYGRKRADVRLEVKDRDTGFKVTGTAKDWKSEIGSRCVGNDLMTLAICAAFSAPLLELAGVESDVLHFHGRSSQGKSTLLMLAASGFGVPVRSWKTTANGLQAAATVHNDLPLCLDEISQASAAEVSKASYDLANEGGKLRANTTGRLATPVNYRIKAISSGECSLVDHVEGEGLTLKQGQEIRFLSMPVDGHRHGVFDNLHGATNGESFATALKRASKKFRGVVGAVFLTELASNRRRWRKEVREEVRLQARMIKEQGDWKLTAPENRVLERFALMAAAGEKATAMDLTGWEKGWATRATGSCFRAWLKAHRRAARERNTATLEPLLEFVKTERKRRFSPLSKGVPGQKDNHAGYRGTVDGFPAFIFERGVFEREACKGRQLGLVLRTLSDLKLLVEGAGGRQAYQKRVAGETKRKTYYVVKQSFFEDK